MNILLNSMPFIAADDGWFQLAKTGEFRNVDKKGRRIVQVIDEKAFSKILQNFKRESRQENFTGLLVDYDHDALRGGKSEAAGWIDELEVRNNSELWAHIRLTTNGKEAIQDGRYRGISCSVSFDKIGSNRCRPVSLLNAGLTNIPNLKGMAPLSNKEPQHTGVNAMNEQIISLLGLKEGASDEDVTTALNSVIEKANTVEGLTKQIGELVEQNKVLLNAQVEADLEQYKDVIENSEAVKASLLGDREGTLSVLQALKPAVTATANVVHNRAHAVTPEPAIDESNRESMQMTMVEDYQSAKNCDFSTAWDACKRQKPELFKPATSSED